ncbi:MAG: hypothetical protein H0W61_09125 [Bacteroidetes bacterium]|nr:hypothetical protein [Bacteroidota bacterium]
MSHDPTTSENVSKQTAVLWSIALDSTSGIGIDGLRVGMTQKEMESYLGPWKRLDGPSDSITFYYKSINLLFTATKNVTGQYIVKTIERIYVKTQDE